ncbi:L-proline dehydrogenase /delta-1-pyrroline-5-carboxylate dehydrogenase [Pseudooceanicola antarcticus]|uniref:Bifunctional protein PutA n=1 Tax=Pseudooceanicola antarcticus TaxID=1247613 RepID=A0A285HTX6_9RHOB|nr:bifunctional proline dehydrogenase/L-glutamate gamma-semialdehyde dehydrogenase PutA [Pseudooceanicola antarcticus]PJE27528.1 bifunctional proline dehydrogenase/L-glutamate gamma-semialdehyde dehydrogenase PutA [Pseudooceanicola antarcticus]SNY39145.1 L-proline dehydrogenase /delta-1-pyrroline-5-carboxylate dehydrogenase [Pseudooceanicola antarcticus]
MQDQTTPRRFDALEGHAKHADEAALSATLVEQAGLGDAARAMISHRAADLVRRIRGSQKPTLMEHFLGEYGLSTREGVALMCLAEAMLRVPDKLTIDALIEDKIAPSDWSSHVGRASSPLVNASTWALMLTGRVLDDEGPRIAATLRGAVKRLGEPVIRTAVGRAMKEMGRQFVLGETIEKAMDRARSREAEGYSYSYDMLGEAAMTAGDAARYARDYAQAIEAIAKGCTKGSVKDNPGISIKLSALHPRYEVAKEERVMAELVPVVTRLARAARAAGMGLNIDAEEQDRLVLSLKVIEAVIADPQLAGWDGFGVVVQAYGKRAGATIDWLYRTAEAHDRRIMVRLVKGAYWDTEMKLAQVEGLADFPLFTSKIATDVSYIANARKLIGYADRIYPQFATHNAHTVAAILEMAGGIEYEFQRLHGMGERLHDIVIKEGSGRCRIYAPVGAHKDLLAYLVRRLLENGANSSFVNQIVDEDVSPEEIARDPFAALAEAHAPAGLVKPAEIFGAGRLNSRGFDLTDTRMLATIEAARDVEIPDAGPLVAGAVSGRSREVMNPAHRTVIARVVEADQACVEGAIAAAAPWQASPQERAEVLRRVADLYEANFGLFFAVLSREAGKTLNDCVGELREAVDFLRFYADEGARREDAARGIFTAISPWNFPLAIFTGQIAAALAAGNGVLAKPAEQTCLTAAIAVRLLHEAGVPVTALQLLPGDGKVGAMLTASDKVQGVAFTGSTETARIIRRAMSQSMDPGAPLIAETGGLNAMIVDSTALPEQAVRDIVASSFQSAGQRCSALRCLYLQEDIAPHMIEMIKGAMDELHVGDPWLLSTDVGPVIDEEARAGIADYIAEARREGRLLHELAAPEAGTFIAPTLLEVPGIEAMEREVFGPVLHVATFKGRDLHRVIGAINATGYGLTFGLHTRIDTRVQEVTEAIHAGNLYVNRNQIGAIVGSQPFGGEGLSGTGPKAGGPNYLDRFRAAPAPMTGEVDGPVSADRLAEKLKGFSEGAPVSEDLLPGPTGELNRLAAYQRAPLLCMGPGSEAEAAQLAAIEALGGQGLAAGGVPEAQVLTGLAGISGALWWGDAEAARGFAQALAERDGPILPLVTGLPDRGHALHERHLCVDTTAAGGNAALLAGAGE